MVIERAGAGDDLINGHVIRRTANQTTGCPDWSNIEACTFAGAYQTARYETEAPTIEPGDLKDGYTNKVINNPLTPAEAPTAFAQASDTPPPWTDDMIAPLGIQVTYNSNTYICIQHHTAQVDWFPEAVPALWVIVRLAGDPWVQPLGGHDAYKLGAIVSHNGTTWENTLSDANVWEPGVIGWTEI